MFIYIKAKGKCSIFLPVGANRETQCLFFLVSRVPFILKFLCSHVFLAFFPTALYISCTFVLSVDPTDFLPGNLSSGSLLT